VRLRRVIPQSSLPLWLTKLHHKGGAREASTRTVSDQPLSIVAPKGATFLRSASGRVNPSLPFEHRIRLSRADLIAFGARPAVVD
jgi:hypothetical protein